ncbi:MAG: hypothetical protein AAF614_39820 [Chloroflexota bacterium]
MSSLDYKFSYRRRLPHFQPEGYALFVTFRLKGSIPQAVLEEWQQQKAIAENRLRLIQDSDECRRERYDEQKGQYGRYDRFLDQASHGPTWLKNKQIAQILVDAMHYRDEKVYGLDAFCLMSNHAHIVFEPLAKEDGSYHSLPSIMHSLKRFTAEKANLVLGRTGRPFWQPESYDHVIRDRGERERIIKYVLNNPVAAGLVESWDEWPWSYCKYF